MTTVLAIYRARRFSPASVENDRRILDAVVALLNKNPDMRIVLMSEEEFTELSSLPECDLCISMARSSEALKRMEGIGCAVVNSPKGIRTCNERWLLDDEMRRIGIPTPGNSSLPAWIKRGEGCAMVADDTVFCTTEADVDKAIHNLHQRGITNTVRHDHIVGDLVKFYGVADTPFFHTIYPTDLGRSKFGSEHHNGIAHHYPFDATMLKRLADTLAIHIGVKIYGGDAIISCDGSIHIIDFNDWPTFSPCCNEAARTIYNIVKQQIE